MPEHELHPAYEQGRSCAARISALQSDRLNHERRHRQVLEMRQVVRRQAQVESTRRFEAEAYADEIHRQYMESLDAFISAEKDRLAAQAPSFVPGMFHDGKVINLVDVQHVNGALHMPPL